ncbi:MAG TPA: D-arabinono-1,4-lactone oxidase, partial [Micromonosporaceae bacterium]|nr:D-arabinono-1,4-lactone oxidase [Micromonosporaceae bacterium]
AAPEDEAAVVALVRRARDAGVKVRPVGSGHSSSPLVRTDGILVSLDRLTDVPPADEPSRRATVGAGTRLHEIGAGLAHVGLAMENLGDVDYQTIAGAIATGTHGTGLHFGNLSTQVAGVRLVTGTGAVLEISERQHPELLPAARLSLGALGIVTRITLRLQPRFDVDRRVWCAPIDWTLANLSELQQQNRNMDFYWYPRDDLTQIRTVNRRGEIPELQPPSPPTKQRTGPSHREIPQRRELRFDEIEYSLPSTAFPDCFAQLRKRIRERHRTGVAWRVLVRTVAADDIHLSTAHGRATTTIACLQNAGLPHEEYFADMEAVFRDHGGRPHWGKHHSLTAAQLRPLYPEWETFGRIRRTLDPDGVFLTPDLALLLEDA